MKKENKSKKYRKVENLEEIKKLISKEIISGYKYKINLDDPYFLIEIGEVLILSANLYKEKNKMVYKFVFNTRFIGDYLVTDAEVKMINAILDILNCNKELITSKFKKYTVEEYEEEEKKANEILEQVGTAFKKTLEKFYEENRKKEEKNSKEIKELAAAIVRITVNEIFALEEEINEIIENKCKNEKLIKYIFNRILFLEFTPIDQIEEIYYKLLNYTKTFNKDLANQYEGELVKYYNNNYAFDEDEYEDMIYLS